MVDRGDKYLRLLTGLIFLQTLSLSLCLLITFVHLVCYLVFLPETRWRPHSWLFPHLAVPIPTAPGSPYVLYRLSLGSTTEPAGTIWFAAETAVIVVFAKGGVMQCGTASRGLWRVWQPARRSAVRPGGYLTLAPRARTVSFPRVGSS